MESTWKHLRLEPEDESAPKQREGETATAFRRRVERCVAEADRKAKAAEQKAERERRKRHEQRVRRHDAAVPPERREGESNHDFNRRERRFRDRVRPALARGRYNRHRHAAAAGGAVPSAHHSTQQPLLARRPPLGIHAGHAAIGRESALA